MLSYGQKHIMLSAVYIREKKTYIRISFLQTIGIER